MLPQLLSLGKMDRADMMINSPNVINRMPMTFRLLVAKRAVRLSLVFGCAVLLFGAFTLSDYIAVTQFHQVPRFSYETVYDSRLPDQLVHKTLFFTAIQQNPGTPQERIYIVK